jgi:hypothetical protein
MKYAVEMGSGAMMYIPSFIKIGSGIQTLGGGIHRHAQMGVFSLHFPIGTEETHKETRSG